MYDAPHYKGSEKLKDMVAIITGADSGIGRKHFTNSTDLLPSAGCGTADECAGPVTNREILQSTAP